MGIKEIVMEGVDNRGEEYVASSIPQMLGQFEMFNN